MREAYRAKLSNLVKKYFPDDDHEVMEYGITTLISKLVFFMTIVTVGIIFGKLASILLFTLFYTPLRSYAGGIHAATPARCYILSLLMLASVGVFLKYFECTKLMLCFSIIISGMALFVLSPVEDQNKPLDEKEIKVYRKRSLLIWSAETLIGFISALASIQALFSCIFYVDTTVSVMLVSGGIKNKTIRSKEK